MVTKTIFYYISLVSFLIGANSICRFVFDIQTDLYLILITLFLAVPAIYIERKFFTSKRPLFTYVIGLSFVFAIMLISIKVDLGVHYFIKKNKLSNVLELYNISQNADFRLSPSFEFLVIELNKNVKVGKYLFEKNSILGFNSKGELTYLSVPVYKKNSKSSNLMLNSESLLLIESEALKECSLNNPRVKE